MAIIRYTALLAGFSNLGCLDEDDAELQSPNASLQIILRVVDVSWGIFVFEWVGLGNYTFVLWHEGSGSRDGSAATLSVSWQIAPVKHVVMCFWYERVFVVYSNDFGGSQWWGRKLTSLEKGLGNIPCCSMYPAPSKIWSLQSSMM